MLTRKQYKKALKRVDSKMNADLEGEEEKWFERLVDKVEEYENHHYPMPMKPKIPRKKKKQLKKKA